MSVQWVVPKDILEIVVDLLDNVPSRNGINSSEFIKVSKLGSDGAMLQLCSSLSGKAILKTGEEFPFNDDLFLDRRLFFPFVKGGKESKSADYVFLGKSTQLIVKHGNRRAVYTYAAAITGYEEPLGLDTANVTSINKKWTNIVACAQNCATDDPITPRLNCVYIKQTGAHIEALSSDEQLVFIGKVETDKKPLKSAIAFPLALIDTLRQEGATKLLWTDKLALVEFPKGKVWAAVKSVARKKFPEKEIRSIVADILKAPLVCTISSNVLAKAANRLSDYTSALDSTDLALEIHITKGSKKVELKAGVADSKFTEIVYSVKEAKQDADLAWPLLKIMPIIMFGKDEGHFRIHLDKSGKSCITSKNLTLALPKRSK